MEVISLYPSKVLKKELERLARRDGRSLNNFILSILNKHIGSRR